MRRSRRVLATALLGLLVGLLTTIPLVVPAGAAFVSGGKAPSDQPTYSYDSPPTATTLPTKALTDAPQARPGRWIASRSSASSISDFCAAKGGSRGLDAILDSTGKVHGPLPKPADLGKYDPEDLARLRDELGQSVQKRIQKTVELGSDYGHSERLAEEQALIRSINKHLADR